MATNIASKPANMTATFGVIGNWEAPAQLRKDQAGPDMVLMGRVQDLLGYKTRRTILEWWVYFPCRAWWEYAYQATKAWSNHPNYKYFLLALLEAARGTDRARQWLAALRRIFGKVMASAAYKEKARFVQSTAPGHKEGCTCERCFELVHTDLRSFEEGERREKQRLALVF